MSPPAVMRARPATPRQPHKRDWAAVIAGHACDDWPPPAWLASATAEAGEKPVEKAAA